ncbi:c-type cytochrome biogenesis protein CcmI [Candidatus Sodalis endolongispinus]|uniref:C-type cytochrome biogenesis protein CcmI n=1 Tax=Candidatus Sodalis endolongispinus TaxID=2812662 RepID=A0ABS5Y9F6_9GAMM|nr:c-type cytochrome biogenesis protein CcmI [Candidatus Sodalis endolongispinus]MBT9431604.1 c-type cytochrome biogenesis protein CcmI [Candidatus Sodalis endolongispinus]
MGFVTLVIVLLLLACALFVLPALGYGVKPAAMSRDQLNTRFYQRRLDELAHDEREGVVSERAQHIEDLQRALLAPGVVVLLVVALGLYALTGGAGQVVRWRQTVDAFASLRARVMDIMHGQPLSAEELSRFAVGLRAELHHDPQNLQNWLILGRLGVVLNNAELATQALAKARQLALENDTIALDYASVLTRYADPGDNGAGNRLLQAILAKRPHDLQALDLLALNEYQQNNDARAVALCREVLARLPAADARAAAIRQHIAQAKAQGGLDQATLNVVVTLSPAAAAGLPPQGTLFISVSDGQSPIPVAVKPFPLSRFPLSLSLDDSNAMIPERLLSAQRQVKVRVRVARDVTAQLQRGDWFGESSTQPFGGNGRVAVEINQQLP